MEEISFNGEKYLKASVIADKFGYTSDYIGQLCRGKQVKATLVGRSWYVNEDSMWEHKKGRYRSSLAKTKESVRKVVKNKDHKPPVVPRYLNRVANYEQDESELLPSVKKKTDSTEEQGAKKVSVSPKKTEKSSDVTKTRRDYESRDTTKRHEYHPAVRVIKARHNIPSKNSPEVSTIANRHRKETNQSRPLTKTKFRKNIFLKFFSLVILLSTSFGFLAGSLLLEKQISMTAGSDLSVTYQISYQKASSEFKNFLSTYFVSLSTR